MARSLPTCLESASPKHRTVLPQGVLPNLCYCSDSPCWSASLFVATTTAVFAEQSGARSPATGVPPTCLCYHHSLWLDAACPHEPSVSILVQDSTTILPRGPGFSYGAESKLSFPKTSTVWYTWLFLFLKPNRLQRGCDHSHCQSDNRPQKSLIQLEK